MTETAWERRSPDVYWAQGDTAPAISEVLKDGTGAVVDLTGASVRFLGTFPDAASTAQNIDQAATITPPATNGTVSYTPISADTDTPGDLMLAWKVTFAGGAVEHFLNSTYQKLRILKS